MAGGDDKSPATAAIVVSSPVRGGTKTESGACEVRQERDGGLATHWKKMAIIPARRGNDSGCDCKGLGYKGVRVLIRVLPNTKP